jgi:hypothetical protein
MGDAEVLIEDTHHNVVVSYTRARITGLTSDRVWLDTPYGSQAFSREDGRWSEGPCLNYLHARIRTDDLMAHVHPSAFQDEAPKAE